MKTPALVLMLSVALSAQTIPWVRESARRVPIAYNVDVVVVGGSTGAVAAAVAAAGKGAKVFLAAPRPYLGEDVCAPMRLWLEEGEVPSTPLAKALFASSPGNPRGPFTPMHIKKTLDEALLEAKVEFLFSCYATDVLRDARGAPAGIVMANRAGRQAVVAKVIVDATARASVARMAGARYGAYPGGSIEFRRVVVGGEAKGGDGYTALRTGLYFSGALAPQVKGKPAPAPAEIVEYKIKIPMADGSFASFANAEQMARDLTYSEGEQAITDEIFQVPPDPVRGTAQQPLGAFQPAGVERMFVVSGSADLPRDEAVRLSRPPALMEAGARIGEAAAALAQRTAVVKGARVSARELPNALTGEVKEPLGGVRSMGGNPGTVSSPNRTLDVLARYDVVVVGGGTGGAPAGIGAGRSGARTLVIEYQNSLGGVGTLGLISNYYWGFRGGFTREVPGEKNWNPIQRAEWWRRTLRRAGTDIWFGVIGCGAYVEGGRVAGVVVATPQGRGVVLAKTVIDSTGNADIAAAAGAETSYTGASEMAQQGTGLPGVKLDARYTNTDFTIADELDMKDVWHLLVYAKSKNASSFDSGRLVDTRERRMIVGDFTMTILDQINQRTYPDTISIAYSNFDTHGYTVDPYFLLEHPNKKGHTINVPYRCLLPKGLDGILVTGLGVSAHRDAIPMIRMQPDVQNQGYAAGMAAAVAAREGRGTRAIDIRALQKRLAEVGIVPESALTATDSYPLSKERIADAVAGLKDIPALLTQPEIASPLLRQAYQSAATEKDKLAYAQILAVLGDPAGVDTLAAAVEAQGWDKGWNYRGMGQFGAALSHLDSQIVALGRTRDRRALPVILKKLDQLDDQSEFSHHRAVALALESIGDPSAAAPIARLLAKPGLRGRVVDKVDVARERTGSDTNDTRVRALSLRELGWGRALLRCGDHKGLGRQILTEYTRDLRGHFARHALAVLESAR
jgi:flavin-dependent dehydrogenase